MMRNQLGGTGRAIMIVPVMSADDLPVGTKIGNAGKIFIILCQYIAVRIAQAD